MNQATNLIFKLNGKKQKEQKKGDATWSVFSKGDEELVFRTERNAKHKPAKPKTD